MLDCENLPQTIREILSARNPRSAPDSSSHNVHAAVLIPVFRDDGRYKVLFTKRTRRVEHHKGQISFPGGAVDEADDNFEETAIREAYEEIGLLREDVIILGRVDDALTATSNFIVHPFVGLIPHPYDFRLNTYEVEELVRVPLDVFFSNDSLYKRDTADIEGIKYQGTVYQYNDDLIWGATAGMMENFVDIIGEKLNLPIEGQ